MLTRNDKLTEENIFTDYGDLVSTAELTEMLGVGETTALRLMNDGTIPCLKIQSRYKIPKRAVIEYLNIQLEKHEIEQQERENPYTRKR